MLWLCIPKELESLYCKPFRSLTEREGDAKMKRIQKKKKISACVQGQILSDGIAHTDRIVRTCMHTKALLNVFITLSHEMKILISAQYVLCPVLRPRSALASLSLALGVHPHAAIHHTPANSLNGNTLIMMAETYIPTPSIRLLARSHTHTRAHAHTHS